MIYICPLPLICLITVLNTSRVYNQERLNDLIDDVLLYEGKNMPVYLHTKQGTMRVR